MPLITKTTKPKRYYAYRLTERHTAFVLKAAKHAGIPTTRFLYRILEAAMQQHAGSETTHE